MKFLLVIPTYNCENQVMRLLKKSQIIIESEFQEMLIIDNGSVDETVAAAIESAGEININIKIVRNRTNINLGGSLKTGFLYAKRNSFDYVAVLHGDDQARLQDMLPILRLRESNEFDLAIGARFHPESKLIGYSMFRKIGNRVLNIYCRICTQTKIDDLIAGLNIFRVSTLPMQRLLNFPNDLTFDVHLLLSALYEGQQIQFFPISWTEVDQVSNAKVIRQAWTILSLFTKFALNPAKVFIQDNSIDSYENYDLIYEKTNESD